MKYVILSDSDNIEPFIVPRQLLEVNGEPLIKRTIRLLKENGVEDILVTSHDPRFDNLGATRYEPLYNDYKPKLNIGYWLSAFPIELLTGPITFLLGDVFYSEDAIKTIIKEETNSILFFCTYHNKNKKYIKHHDEPLGFKVVDYKTFIKHIDILKRLKDEGKTLREPIAWELYRSINGINIKTHALTKNYIAINDETCDVDRVVDIDLLKLKIGGIKMVKVKCIVTYNDLQLNRLVNIGEELEVTNERAETLLDKQLVEVIEVIPEEKKEKPTEPKKPVKKQNKKK